MFVFHKGSDILIKHSMSNTCPIITCTLYITQCQSMKMLKVQHLRLSDFLTLIMLYGFNYIFCFPYNSQSKKKYWYEINMFKKNQCTQSTVVHKLTCRQRWKLQQVLEKVAIKSCHQSKTDKIGNQCSRMGIHWFSRQVFNHRNFPWHMNVDC